MGYGVTIVRKKNWDDFNESSNISLEEWLMYANSDKELQSVGEPGFFNWTEYPDTGADGMPWFEYYEGFINTKNPDSIVLKKMLSIAKALDARLQGEEGEYYDEKSLRDIGML